MLVPSLSSKFQSVEPLQGDASTRRYFRLLAKSGKGCVAAVYPADDAGQTSSRAFVAATKHLRQHRFPVPRILGAQKHGGILLLEDMGSEHLADFVRARGERASRPLYFRAVDMLVTLHGAATEALPAAHPAHRSVLDEARLFGELEHTHKHFVRGFLRAKLSHGQEKMLLDGFAAIAKRAACQPWVLCHRDYHSRNLMAHDGALGVIDHQDMCRGPYTYDLASLLRDSYVEISDRLRRDLLARFLARSKKRWNGRPFLEEFEYAALQRNLKALGTFAFQQTERGSSRYLPHIPPTLRHVWQNLRRFDEEFEDVRVVLKECVAKAFPSKRPKRRLFLPPRRRGARIGGAEKPRASFAGA